MHLPGDLFTAPERAGGGPAQGPLPYLDDDIPLLSVEDEPGESWLAWVGMASRGRSKERLAPRDPGTKAGGDPRLARGLFLCRCGRGRLWLRL